MTPTRRCTSWVLVSVTLSAGALSIPAGANAPPKPVLTKSRQTHVSRYTGTIGGQLVTAELRWQRPDSVTGSFYYQKGSAVYSLNSTRRRAGAKAFILTVARLSHNGYQGEVPTGQWRLSSRLPNAVLAGTWTRPGHPALPFVLHENYLGAVHYGLEELRLTGGEASDDGRVPDYQRDFLTLAQPAAVPATLQRTFASSPATRRRQMLAGREADADVHVWVEIPLNDFGLFCYQTSYDALPFGGRHQTDNQSTLFDIATGRTLTIASQLRPGYERPLRRLLSHHLLHDATPELDEVNKEHNNAWRWRSKKENPSQLVPLPELEEEGADDLALTVEGLQASYSPYSIFESPGGMIPTYSLIVPYRELRPLVRPGTPLARMLQARSMW
jgi:hypothetical protein